MFRSIEQLYAMAFLLLIATSIRADVDNSEHPHAQMPVEEWDGLDLELPLPVYLSDENIRYDLTVTNTTKSAFPIATHHMIDGRQLIWIPYKNNEQIFFSGGHLFHYGDDFQESPLETIVTKDDGWWRSFERSCIERFAQGESIVVSTFNAGMPLHTLPDAIRPYFIVPGKLLTQAAIPIRVDPRKVRDFPMIDPVTGPSVYPFYEIELGGEVFLFSTNYRLCRIPPGMKYEIWEKNEEKFNPGAVKPWIQRLAIVKFPDSDEPDVIFQRGVPERLQASDETDPDKWAKRMGFGSSARAAWETAKPVQRDEPDRTRDQGDTSVEKIAVENAPGAWPIWLLTISIAIVIIFTLCWKRSISRKDQ